MEAMDIFLATTKEVSYLVLNHPLYSAVGSVVVFFSLLRFYCRLTLGICDCDQDMTGKTVLITGASGGIGKATALNLAKRNARVILACRNVAKAEEVAREIRAATGNRNLSVKCLDLVSLESVRKCAKEVLETEERLDVLINNAGVSGIEREITEDGFDKMYQTNYLGHFLFTNLLLDLIKKSAPSRIINVSSAAYTMAKPENLQDFRNDKHVSPFQAYSNTKLANIFLTVELAQRLENTGVTVNSLHPGAVKTDVLKNGKSIILYLIRVLFVILAKSPEEGAQTTVYLAVHPEMAKTTGKYYKDCKEEPLREKQVNKEVAKRFFAATEKALGVTYS